MNLYEQALHHLTHLIKAPSISPQDAGCQDYLAQQFAAMGFKCTQYNADPVSNLYAQYGTEPPLLVFAGHTDVVTPGHLSAWNTPPFQLTQIDGHLYGRGVADMKGALAAMLVMAQSVTTSSSPLQGSLGFLITSGEEGDDYLNGTPFVMERLRAQGVQPSFCIVGEPSSEQRVGDTIKIGRRGSLHAQITLHGKQGHVAYPHLAQNPIHASSGPLVDLSKLILDQGNEHFPPSSLQITSIQSGGEGANVIPGQLKLTLNIRYNTEQDEETLKATVVSCFKKHQLHPEINWCLSGKPFLTQSGILLETCINAIEQYHQQSPILSTSGGTSDARFIAPYGIEVLELGLCHHSIHQVNEHISCISLEQLTDLYTIITRDILQKNQRMDL